MSRFYRALSKMDDSERKMVDMIEIRGDDIETAERARKKLNISGLARYGLCADCYHCFFSRSEFKVKFALCTAIEEAGRVLRLDDREPITECNHYGKRDFTPGIEQMYQMATLIDPPKSRAGFVQEDD